MKRQLALAAALLAAAVAGFFAYRALPTATSKPVASTAPDVTFTSVAGTTQQLSQWRGKLVLLNFWATWCAPCLNEMPLLAEAHRRHFGRGFVVVGVAVDERDAVKAFLARRPVPYPVMVGGPELFDLMDTLGDQLRALPFSVLIAPDGRILERVSGDLDRTELAALLKPHLSP